MMPHRILVICTHNSARSQMMAAYLRHLGDPEWIVESAGLEPAPAVHPLVVQAMAEEGFDLAGITPQSVFQLFREGKIFDVVVTVCGESEDRCPIFPGMTHRLHLPFPDPSALEGSAEERLIQVRAIREAIKEAAAELVGWIREGKPLAAHWMQMSKGAQKTSGPR